MEGRIISKEKIERFYQHLLNEEKSANTVEKYIRDVKAFMCFADGAEITKELVIGYKQKLIEEGYAASTRFWHQSTACLYFSDGMTAR